MTSYSVIISFLKGFVKFDCWAVVLQQSFLISYDYYEFYVFYLKLFCYQLFY